MEGKDKVVDINSKKTKLSDITLPDYFMEALREALARFFAGLAEGLSKTK